MRLPRGSSSQRGTTGGEDVLGIADSEPEVSHEPVIVALRDDAMPPVSDDDDEFLSQEEDLSDIEDELLGHSGGVPEAQKTPAGGNTTAEAHVKNGRFDKAIIEYSATLQLENSREQQIALLLGRAEAYCGMSQHLRSIPAAQSEVRAVYAPDPLSLASRALRDGDSALKLEAERATAVHRTRGNALFLLERYKDAQEAYRLAYAHCPDPELSTKIANCERALSDDNGTSLKDQQGGVTAPQGSPAGACLARLAACKAQALQDAECSLCLKLLYEPVTTPCGHTFCSPCLARSYDHANKCPMCRTVLHVGQLPVSIVFKNLLERSFPEEYEARRLEEAETTPAAAEPSSLPLFVMSPMLPGERMALNVFEPRYRLMVRRVMAGARRFGMATVNADHSLHEVCCEVEVTECEPLPDGRYYIEIVGRRRFKPCDPHEQDGYRVARPEYVKDKVPEPDSIEATELEALATEVESMADGWVGRMRTLGQSRRAAAELLRRVEPKPTCRDKERLSFWVANLICPVIDDAPAKLRMLCMLSTVQRLNVCKGVLQQLQDASLGGCSLM